MDASQKHPTYTATRVSDWDLCSDAFEGESIVKSAGEKYLPKPSGYSRAGGHDDDGLLAYDSYKKRAQFPEIMAITVGAITGVIHDNEIQIEMPDALNYLREDADGDGMTLVDFHKRITRRLLIDGRFGVLADAPDGGGDPFLAGYHAKSIINWDTDWFVLDECHKKRDGFTWSDVDQYRELAIVDNRYTQILHADGEAVEIPVTGQGSAALNVIPFAVASAKDIGPDIEAPPLVGVARAGRAIYQLSADYRLQLYMTGQETFVTINADAPAAVGAGVVISLKGSADNQPDAKYVGPSGVGIASHREAIELNERQAVQSGARMFEQGSQANESGHARQLRFKSETANMMTVAGASCSLLERSLRNVALLKGLPTDDITVTPPKELLNATVSPADAAALWQIVQSRGLSYDTFYSFMQSGGLASVDRTADEEFALIEARDVFTPPLGEDDDGEAV